MTEDIRNARIRSRASSIREIAKGVFDKNERQILLNFVADAEELAKNVAKPSSGDGID